jgi:hypothetical protein
VFSSDILINDALGFCQAHISKKKKIFFFVVAYHREAKKNKVTPIEIKE